MARSSSLVKASLPKKSQRATAPSLPGVEDFFASAEYLVQQDYAAAPAPG
jgi:hypothetical protein